MEFSVKSGSPEKQRSACIVVGVYEPRRLSPIGEQLDKISDGYISNLLRRGDLEGKPGQVLLLHHVPNVLSERVLLVGCGKERELDDKQYKQIISKTINTLNETGSMEAVCFLTEQHVKSRDTYWKVRQAVETTQDCLYTFNQLKSKKSDPRRPLRKIVFNVPTRRELTIGESAIEHGLAIAAGSKLCKDVANMPPNICNPAYLGEQAQELADNFDNVTVDSGGISIKPGEAMDEMKYDMGGAAGVIGTMRALAQMQLPINVVGVLAGCENMPGSNAYRPGDILTTMSGQTVEVLNTDAEGRLVLCDALTYVERFEPDTVVDVATLTGACIIALGSHATGLLSNHNPLAHDLLKASEQSGDRAWQLPLWDDYQEQLESPFADFTNLGGRAAGTITAACFLSKFTKKYNWAHLDIAGTAWRSGGKNKGATGRPVPMLTQYLLNRAGISEASHD